jgi:hypothetical protein
MSQNYRNSDPTTSMLSGLAVEGEGTAQRQREICLAAVIATPGATAREIEDRIGIKAHKRLPELREEGVIFNGKPRTCRISGRKAMTWHHHTIQDDLFNE